MPSVFWEKDLTGSSRWIKDWASVTRTGSRPPISWAILIRWIRILEWYREHTSIGIREYNPVKDATDTQIAVELALGLGSSRITILGGTGSRVDHMLGNIQTMYLALEKGVECQMLDPNNRVRLIRDRFCLRREEQYGDYFSLIPLTTDVTGVTLRGVKYPLTDYHFTVRGSAGLGVSNEITGEEAQISMKSGILILIESRD